MRNSSWYIGGLRLSASAAVRPAGPADGGSTAAQSPARGRKKLSSPSRDVTPLLFEVKSATWECFPLAQGLVTRVPVTYAGRPCAPETLIAPVVGL